MDGIFTVPADTAGRQMMRDKLSSDTGIYPVSLGKSILGRDIEVYYIGKGDRRVAFFGAHHAAESITCNLLFAFMHALLTEKIETHGTVARLLLRAYTFTVVPCVNPDGIELRLHGTENSPLAARQRKMAENFDLWQANARGVDLNHNYDLGFYAYKSLESEQGISPGATRYSGEYPESEPESKSAANLVRCTSPSAVLSLHSQGEEIYYSPRTPRTARIAQRLCAITGYTPRIPEGTAAYGGLCDYTGSLGIPSFTLEVGRGKNPLPESEIPRIAGELFPALALFPTML
ncbi:MAG: gamma-D-glutamyl-meso-diaminopimelate peptidase [Clostridia bacterium]|nr:gamma-D-glutamyl-meso-diaminopimelate peptidase [Clostridia bacterium]